MSFERDTTRIERTRSRFRRSLERIRSKAEGIQRDAAQRLTRIRVLLMARLDDYSRELEFWRNTIRKLVLASGEDRKSAEQLLKQVSKSLGTHHTGQYEDFEALRVAAKLLTRADGEQQPL